MMKQLSKTQSIIMLAGGMTMVICSGIIMMTTLAEGGDWVPMAQKLVPWFFLAGAIAFVAVQRMQRYTGTSMTITRLRSIQLLSGICFIVAGLLMIENFCHLVQPYVVSDMSSYFTYVQVVHNNWVVMLLIGAVLQMYTVHRIASELQKDS